MEQFVKGMDHARNERTRNGDTAFTDEPLARYKSRYEELIGEEREENQKTKGCKAKKEENALLNRLEKSKTNHLLFLYDFKIPFSNNMSEKDLRMRVLKPLLMAHQSFKNEAEFALKGGNQHSLEDKWFFYLIWYYKDKLQRLIQRAKKVWSIIRSDRYFKRKAGHHGITNSELLILKTSFLSEEYFVRPCIHMKCHPLSFSPYKCPARRHRVPPPRV